MILIHVRQETGMGPTATSSHQQIHNSATQKHTEPILSINSIHLQYWVQFHMLIFLTAHYCHHLHSPAKTAWWCTPVPTGCLQATIIAIYL
jgi:hypothetical protein